jgi:hypothetical protein
MSATIIPNRSELLLARYCPPRPLFGSEFGDDEFDGPGLVEPQP